MDKIDSFKINHLTLKSGLYVSRTDEYNGAVTTTFDLRTITPYYDDFMDVSAMHTIEHLGATFFRNSSIGNKIVYFGPMGCQTGFYLVVFGEMESKDVFDYVVDMCDFILTFKGEIPGASKIECGNYLSHDLEGAKLIIAKYKKELITYKRLTY